MARIEKPTHEYLIQGYDADGEFIAEKLVVTTHEFEALVAAAYRMRNDSINESKRRKRRWDTDHRILASLHVVRIDGHENGA